MSRRTHIHYEPRVLTPEDRAMWEEAFREAEQEQRDAERGLGDLKREIKAVKAEWHRRREVLKEELREAVKLKKSAAFALLTGRDADTARVSSLLYLGIRERGPLQPRLYRARAAVSGSRGSRHVPPHTADVPT